GAAAVRRWARPGRPLPSSSRCRRPPPSLRRVRRSWPAATGAPSAAARRPGPARSLAPATRPIAAAGAVEGCAAAARGCAAGSAIGVVRDDAQRLLGEPLDVAQVGALLAIAERQRDPARAGARRAADAVHVALGLVGQL